MPFNGWKRENVPAYRSGHFLKRRSASASTRLAASTAACNRLARGEVRDLKVRAPRCGSRRRSGGLCRWFVIAHVHSSLISGHFRRCGPRRFCVPQAEVIGLDLNIVGTNTFVKVLIGEFHDRLQTRYRLLEL
jgi:hypothetical protein